MWRAPRLRYRLGDSLLHPKFHGSVRGPKHGWQRGRSVQTKASGETRDALSAENVVLIDASCFCFRFYHGAKKSIAIEGTSTAIEHLFLKKVLGIVSGKQRVGFGKASQLVVVFDGKPSQTGGTTVRRSLFPGYKANRSKTPEDVIAAMDHLPVVLQSMGINAIRMPGVEADDVIATLVTAYAQREAKVTIVSLDKDFKQLLSEDACLERLKEVETLESFTEQHRFLPQFFPDYQALTGDSADNVPGVPGIGPKTAQKLVSKFLTIENIYTALPGMGSNITTRRLAAMDLVEVLQLRTVFQLQRYIRTKDGEDLFDVLPFGPANLISIEEADTAEVLAYMDRLELKQDKAAFLALIESHELAQV